MGIMQLIYSEWLTPPDRTNTADDPRKKPARVFLSVRVRSGSVPARPTTRDRKSVPSAV